MLFMPIDPPGHLPAAAVRAHVVSSFSWAAAFPTFTVSSMILTTLGGGAGACAATNTPSDTSAHTEQQSDLVIVPPRRDELGNGREDVKYTAFIAGKP